MKLIEIRNFEPDDPQRLPQLLMATDSSIITGKRPVFPPALSQRWTLEILPAYRVSRLGKTIPQRFAPRYFDAMTLSARMVPLDLLERLAAQGFDSTSPLATAFDGSVALGRWIPPTATFAVTLSSPADILVENVNPIINQSLSYISKTFIIKNGDVIVVGNPLISIPAEIGNRVVASIGADEVLAYNIK